ncbi:MAG: peptidylprolyl isomerase [Elusimicrobia bacterium]|nr:peptidylprolyl isomerase [Elusimicrobiota bacterium]
MFTLGSCAKQGTGAAGAGKEPSMKKPVKEAEKVPAAAPAAKPAAADERYGGLEPGLYAVITVTQGENALGDVIIRLYQDRAPVTVQNFTDLAEGKKEFMDMKTGHKAQKRFYDGLVFHRVIPKFMIQGGDPLGNGRGGPGYRFPDEIVPGLNFSRPGLLAMANSGPDTNGSQFFITVTATPWLNGKHTIFGGVVKGQDIVETVSNVERDQRDRPLVPVIMKKVDIIRVK